MNVVVVLQLVIVLLSFPIVFATTPAVSPPNVLLIIADDFKPMLDIYGSPFISKYRGTPNIDALAARSVSFMNAHAQMSLCGPSRASFLTSIRPSALGIVNLQPNVLAQKIKLSKVKKNKEILLLPKLFKLNGYRVLGMGKIFHVRETTLCDAEDVWSEPMWTPIPKLARPPAFSDPFSGPWLSSPEVEDDFYADGQMARLAKQMIEDDLGAEMEPGMSRQPWFLTLGFYKPHTPFSAPKKYFDMIGPASDYPSSYNTEIANLSVANQNIAKGEGCTELKYYVNSPKLIGFPAVTPSEVLQEANRGYHAMVMYLDVQIGLVMNALNSSSARDDTIVVFMGDHGFHLGDKGLYCKHTNFEQATKTPWFISPALRDSTFARNVQSFAPVELLDLMPTLKELAGLNAVDISPYRAWEGQSLINVMKNPSSAFVKPGAYSQFNRKLKSKRMWGYSVRTTRYRLTYWEGKAAPSFLEVYDYLVNPEETISYHQNQELVNTLFPLIKNKFKLNSTPPVDADFLQDMKNMPPLSMP